MPGELAQQTVSRLTADPQALHARPGGLVIAVDIPSLDISATVIRTLIHTGHSARYLLPDDVLDYIERNRLYKDFDAD
jgi:nicotinate-nucleotide adenylyltransferase